METIATHIDATAEPVAEMDRLGDEMPSCPRTSPPPPLICSR